MALPPSSSLDGSAAAEPFVAGLSHRTAPADLLERLQIDDVGAERLLSRLSQAGLKQAVVLATCERLEVHGADPSPTAAASTALAAMAAALGLGLSEIERYAYGRTGPEALRHLFLVAASLDSLVPGEPQILGQLKGAHRRALSTGLVGQELEAALQAAYDAAARVRAETEIAEHPVSLLSVGERLVRAVLDDLAGAGALLLGQGEMGAALAEHLRAMGIGSLTVASSAEGRGHALARALGGRYRPLADLDSALAEGDIVIAAASAGRPAITPAAVSAALKRRQRRPMLLFDLGVPGDIDPRVQDLDDAFVYGLDDLERIASGGHARRERATAAASAILEEELARHDRAVRLQRAVPAIVALRRHFETVRAELLARGRDLDAQTATRLLVNRLLHEPSMALRELAGERAHTAEDRSRIERILLKLFGIDRRYGHRRGEPDRKNDVGNAQS